MEAATQVPQKYAVQNNTAGWVGVVKLDHRGEERGEAVEPYGTVWLSETEMICTARAPKLPEDNPFEEQVFIVSNPETGAREEHKVRPLSLMRDGRRYTPAEERYVPSVRAPVEAAPAPVREPAAPEETATTPATNIAPQASPPAAAAVPAGPQMRRGADPLPGAPAPPAEPQSWIQDPLVPGEVLPGQLKGSDETPTTPVPAPEPAGPDDRFVPSIVGAQAAPQTPGEEEFAEAVNPDIGEETGQAKSPTQPPPEGEYARAEEVGSPDAPASDDTNETNYVWE